MNYEEFKNYVMEHIKEYLPESFKDAELKILSLKKNQVTKDGLNLRQKGSKIAVNLYMEEFFRRYQNGEEMPGILTAMANVFQERCPKELEDFDYSSFLKYDVVKDLIIPVLMGVKNNEDYQESHPSRVVAGDMFVSYKIAKDESKQYTIPITNELANLIGVNEEELYNQALRNINKDDVCIEDMSNVTKRMLMPQLLEMVNGDEAAANEMFEKVCSIPDENKHKTLYVVTTSGKNQGASVMISQEIMDKVAKEAGGDLLIIPSSIHEIIAMKVGTEPVENLKSMVCETNTTSVQDEDKLTDNVYAYNSETRELTTVDEYLDKKKDEQDFELN